MIQQTMGHPHAHAYTYNMDCFLPSFLHQSSYQKDFQNVTGEGKGMLFLHRLSAEPQQNQLRVKAVKAKKTKTQVARVRARGIEERCVTERCTLWCPLCPSSNKLRGSFTRMGEKCLEVVAGLQTERIGLVRG